MIRFSLPLNVAYRERQDSAALARVFRSVTDVKTVFNSSTGSWAK